MNFDAPDVYQLYYAEEVGTPGTVMTYFPFQGMVKGRRGAGEVTETAFAIPKGTLPYWNERLAAHAVAGLEVQDRFGDHRLRSLGPDGDELVLAEVEEDVRQAFKEGPVPQDRSIHGFRSATLRLRDEGATAELLRFRGYEERERHGNLIRFGIKEGNGADLVDIEVQPDADVARQGAGSVHHIAFAVEDRAAQVAVRQALLDTGFQVTPVIDRDYFRAIYFRTPGDVLFEIATGEPGFDRDEDIAHLGEELRIPAQHEHLRSRVEARLEPRAEPGARRP